MTVSLSGGELVGTVRTQPERKLYRIGDAAAGVTVAIGVDGVRHALVCSNIAQELVCVVQYIVLSTPVSLTVPAATASGRSVSFLSTRTGLPSAGASS